MKSNGNGYLRLIKTFSSLSLSRFCPERKCVYSSCEHLYMSRYQVPSVFMLLWFFLPELFTRIVHMYRSMCIFYACIGLHSAIQYFMEFKRIRDLWTELNMILTSISIFCSVGFLSLNLLACFWSCLKESRE